MSALSAIDVKVSNGKQMVSKKKWVPNSQARFANYERKGYTQIDFSNIPTAMFSTAIANWNGVISKGSITNVKNFRLRFQLTATAGTSFRICPVTHFFSQIDLGSNSGQRINQTWFSNSMLAGYTLALGNDELINISPQINIGVDEDNSLVGSGELMSSGDVRTYELVLMGSYIGIIKELNLRNQTEDTQFTFYPNSNLITSGSGTVTLTAMSLICETSNTAYPPRSILGCNFLQPTQISFPSKSMVVGTNQFLLDTLQGKCSHLLVSCHTAGASTSALTQMRNFGYGSSVDIVNSSNESLYGNGRSVNLDFLRNEIVGTSHIRNCSFTSHGKPWFILPFTNNIRGALIDGDMNGYWNFDGSKQYLNITIPTTPVTEVQTISTLPVAVLSSGNITFSWGDGVYTSPLAFDASVTTIKTAVEALPYAKAHSITVVFSNNFTANSGSCAVSITKPESSHYDERLLSCQSYAYTGVADPTAIQTVVTTRPVYALSAGSYDLYITAFLYNSVNYENGKFTTTTL